MTTVETAAPPETQAATPSPEIAAQSAEQLTVPLSLAEFEALIRRIVREEVGRLLPAPKPSVLGDWSQEGIDEPGDEEELVQAALEAIREHEANPDASMDWEEFEEELKRAEVAGELPA